MVDSMGKMCTPLNVELHSYSGVMSYTKQLREVLKKKCSRRMSYEGTQIYNEQRKLMGRFSGVDS